MSLPLLQALADGGYHSGQNLGARLGITRAAVWKQVQQLQANGVDIDSVRGKGYRWRDASPMLNSAQIQAGLQPPAASLFAAPVVEAMVSSTNNLAMAAALSGVKAGYIVVAEAQSGGRGRRNRSWQSPLAQNLYVSCVYRCSHGARLLQGLSLVVGVSLAQTLNARYNIACQVKWPNDLLVADKKLGGILIEVAGDVSGDCAAVIGFGLNVNMRRDQSGTIKQPWTSLARLLGQPLNRNALLAALLNGLQRDLALFRVDGLAAFSKRWQQVDYLAGQPVQTVAESGLVVGTAAGIAADGGLQIDTRLGRSVVHGGEVSVRKVACC